MGIEQHAKYDAMCDMFRAGASVRRVVESLRVGRNTAAAARDSIGLSAYKPDLEAVAELLKAGATNTDVERELKISKRVVAQVRRELGIPVYTQTYTPLLDKLAERSEVGEDGHVRWTGSFSTAGRPVIPHRGKIYPAAHLAFEQRAKRQAVGMVKADCEVRDCLAPMHIMDDLERRNLRMNERALLGMPRVPWDVCPKGLHAWDEHGRLEPSLRPYCKACGLDWSHGRNPLRKGATT